MTHATETKTVAGEKSQQRQNDKGKIIEHAWQLRKENYADATIRGTIKNLNSLIKKGASLYDPESVKKVLAQAETWSNGTKNNIAISYNRFALMNGIDWTPPKYRTIQKIPFIPLEKEIDDLIAGCGRKTATFLQVLKETGMRCGEAVSLQWTDIDFERKTITLNTPEKNGNPRVFKISLRLQAMLNMLPKTNIRLFGNVALKSIRWNFSNQRNKLAFKLQNPRLKRITFHTFRHWKATMEYQRTRNILHVMRLLGHKNIQCTLIYTQLINCESDEYHSATAKNVEEAKTLIENGFDYVTEIDGLKLFRKRK